MSDKTKTRSSSTPVSPPQTTLTLSVRLKPKMGFSQLIGLVNLIEMVLKTTDYANSIVGITAISLNPQTSRTTKSRSTTAGRFTKNARQLFTAITKGKK